jgi:hypothetical protein
MNTLHPIIVNASKICKKCGYQLGPAQARVHTDPHTKKQITTNKVLFLHPQTEMPLDMHRFVKNHMEPSIKSKQWMSKGTNEVTLTKSAHPTRGGHILEFTSVRFKR